MVSGVRVPKLVHAGIRTRTSAHAKCVLYALSQTLDWHTHVNCIRLVFRTVRMRTCTTCAAQRSNGINLDVVHAVRTEIRAQHNASTRANRKHPHKLERQRTENTIIKVFMFAHLPCMPFVCRTATTLVCTRGLISLPSISK